VTPQSAIKVPVDPFEGKAVALALTAVSSFLTIALTIVRSKVSATALGPDGLGVISEVTQVAALVTVPLAVLAGPALTRSLANSETDADGARRALQSSIRLGLIAGLAVPALSALGGMLAFRTFDNSSDRVIWTGLAGVAAWAAGFIAIISTSLIASRRPIRASLIGLAQNTLMAIGSVVGTLVAGITGQLIGVAVGGALLLPWAARSLWSALALLKSPRVTLGWSYLQFALRVGAATLASGFLAQGLASLYRWLAFEHGGSEANGQLQAVMAVSATYFGVVLTSLGVIAFPAFAAARDTEELNGAVNSTVQRVLRLAPPIILIAFAARVPVMRLLYSARFEAASGVLGVQMAGDLPKAVAWALGAPLLLRGHIRAFVIADLLANGALALAAAILVPRYGLAGFGFAYVAGYACALITNALLLWHTCRIRVPAPLLAVALGGAGLLTMLGQANASPWVELGCGAVGVFWALRVGALQLVRELVTKSWTRLKALRARPTSAR
jgi:enterobacterial common antigen flippase